MPRDDSEPCPHRMAGIFEFYSLNSLAQSPKSGYDIIKEIREKSRGNIVASKGAIYPMLDRLEREKTVKVEDTYARGRKVFSLTAKGRRHLKEMAERKRGIRKKMKYLPFLFAGFDRVNTDLDKTLFRIFALADDCPRRNRPNVKSLLEECRKSIEAIE
jgi:DNA-binding PadR family transcriptional regulator